MMGAARGAARRLRKSEKEAARRAQAAPSAQAVNNAETALRILGRENLLFVHAGDVHARPEAYKRLAEILAEQRGKEAGDGDPWLQGYACALGNVARQGQNWTVQTVLQGDGLTVKRLRDAGAEKYDLDPIEEVCSQIAVNVAREEKAPSKRSARAVKSWKTRRANEKKRARLGLHRSGKYKGCPK